MAEADDLQTLQAALDDPAYAAQHDQIRAVLAKKRSAGAPPEVAAHKKALSYAEQQAMTHQPGEGSASDSLPAPPQGPTLGERVSAVGRGAVTLGKTAYREAKSLPGAIMEDPINPHSDYLTKNRAAGRQLIRGASDIFQGYPVKAADALLSATGQGHPYAESEAEDAKKEPDTRTAGSLATAFIPNPYGLVAKGVAPLAGAVVRGSGPIAGAGRAALTYEMTAPPLAAASADAAGHRGRAALDSAIDPLALFLAGTAGAAGGVARGQAAKIRDPRRISGQLIQDVRELGGPDAKITKLAQDPVEGGIFSSPEMTDRKFGREGSTDMATESMYRVNAANDARLKAARQNYDDLMHEIIGTHGDKPIQPVGALGKIREMIADNKSNGTVGEDAVHNALIKARNMLTAKVKTETPGAPGTPAGPEMLDREAMLADIRRANNGSTPLSPAAEEALLAGATPIMKPSTPAVPAGPPTVSVTRVPRVKAAELIRTRKLLRKMANSAETASVKHVYETVIDGLDADAARMDPRIGQLNEQYRSALNPIDSADEIVFRKSDRKVSPELTEAQRLSGISNLKRIGGHGEAGLNRADAAKRFGELGPEYKAEADLMRARNTQEQLRRNGDPGETNLRSTIMRAVRDRNSLQNQVRVMLPAYESAGAKLTGSSAVPVDAVTRLARKRGTKKRSHSDEN